MEEAISIARNVLSFLTTGSLWPEMQADVCRQVAERHRTLRDHLLSETIPQLDACMAALPNTGPAADAQRRHYRELRGALEQQAAKHNWLAQVHDGMAADTESRISMIWAQIAVLAVSIYFFRFVPMAGIYNRITRPFLKVIAIILGAPLFSGVFGAGAGAFSALLGQEIAAHYYGHERNRSWSMIGEAAAKGAVAGAVGGLVGMGAGAFIHNPFSSKLRLLLTEFGIEVASEIAGSAAVTLNPWFNDDFQWSDLFTEGFAGGAASLIGSRLGSPALNFETQSPPPPEPELPTFHPEQTKEALRKAGEQIGSTLLAFENGNSRHLTPDERSEFTEIIEGLSRGGTTKLDQGSLDKFVKFAPRLDMGQAVDNDMRFFESIGHTDFTNRDEARQAIIQSKMNSAVLEAARRTTGIENLTADNIKIDATEGKSGCPLVTITDPNNLNPATGEPQPVRSPDGRLLIGKVYPGQATPFSPNPTPANISEVAKLLVNNAVEQHFGLADSPKIHSIFVGAPTSNMSTGDLPAITFMEQLDPQTQPTFSKLLQQLFAHNPQGEERQQAVAYMHTKMEQAATHLGTKARFQKQGNVEVGRCAGVYKKHSGEAKYFSTDIDAAVLQKYGFDTDLLLQQVPDAWNYLRAAAPELTAVFENGDFKISNMFDLGDRIGLVDNAGGFTSVNERGEPLGMIERDLYAAKWELLQWATIHRVHMDEANTMVDKLFETYESMPGAVPLNKAASWYWDLRWGVHIVKELHHAETFEQFRMGDFDHQAIFEKLLPELQNTLEDWQKEMKPERINPDEITISPDALAPIQPDIDPFPPRMDWPTPPIFAKNIDSLLTPEARRQLERASTWYEHTRTGKGVVHPEAGEIIHDALPEARLVGDNFGPADRQKAVESVFRELTGLKPGRDFTVSPASDLLNRSGAHMFHIDITQPGHPWHGEKLIVKYGSGDVTENAANPTKPSLDENIRIQSAAMLQASAAPNCVPPQIVATVRGHGEHSPLTKPALLMMTHHPGKHMPDIFREVAAMADSTERAHGMRLIREMLGELADYYGSLHKNTQRDEPGHVAFNFKSVHNKASGDVEYLAKDAAELRKPLHEKEAESAAAKTETYPRNYFLQRFAVLIEKEFGVRIDPADIPYYLDSALNNAYADYEAAAPELRATNIHGDGKPDNFIYWPDADDGYGPLRTFDMATGHTSADEHGKATGSPERDYYCTVLRTMSLMMHHGFSDAEIHNAINVFRSRYGAWHVQHHPAPSRYWTLRFLLHELKGAHRGIDGEERVKVPGAKDPVEATNGMGAVGASLFQPLKPRGDYELVS